MFGWLACYINFCVSAVVTTREFSSRRHHALRDGKKVSFVPRSESVMPVSHAVAADLRSGVREPRILIASWLRWATSARLAAELIKLRTDVYAVCPGFHPLLAVKNLQGRYGFKGSQPLASLRRAILKAEPDLIVSGDDETTDHLHRLLDACAAGKTQDDIRIASLIRRSFGSTDVFSQCCSRAALLEAAAEAGVLTPPSAPVMSPQSLSDWIDRHGLPAYLKIDGTHGGNGVEEVRTKDEALRVFKRMSAPPSLWEALKYLIKQQDFGRFGNLLRGRGGVVSIQSSIEGHPANCFAICKEGDVTAYIGVEVSATAKATGFGTLIRVSDNPDMENAARGIARRLGLNGAFGLDFIVEAGGSRAHLVEMNPRVTPLAHFRFGPGHDPSAALRALAAGYEERQARPGDPAARRPEGLIAVFPHMLSRGVPDMDGQSILVDIPWDMPELVRLSMPLPRDLFGFLHEAISRFFL
jgi:hypothetical protein